MNRNERTRIAEETVAIVERGEYVSPSGKRLTIADQVAECLQATKCWSPEQLAAAHKAAISAGPRFAGTRIEVRNETTLQGVRRLVQAHPSERVAVLNFASAKNPGGGFLGGSQAQEESLARSSALYASLLNASDYYEFHRRQSSALYSDHMILSPGCPVIRDDEGQLLDEPYRVTFITSAAPNAGAVAANQPADAAKISAVLRQRATYVLALARHHAADALVLGAWGCGVFRNDPQVVASIFAELLLAGRPWHGHFKTVLFSVLDTSADQGTYRAFAERLA